MPGGCHESILALGPFQDDIGTFFLVKGYKAAVVFPAGLPKYPGFDLAAMCPEFHNAPATDFNMGVLYSNYYPWDARFHDQVGTRRGFAVVATGFQGDVKRGLFQEGGICHGTYGPDFGMGSAERAGIPFAYDAVPMGNYCPHHGVRSGSSQTIQRNLKTAGKVFFVYIHPAKIAYRK
jgi:hypothetical protein